MKFLNIFKSIAVFCLLFVATPAKSAPVPVDLTLGLWSVNATQSIDAGGFGIIIDYAGTTLKFDSQVAAGDTWNVSGYFDWISNFGSSGREKFTGTLASDYSLELNGFELVNPVNLGLADYFGLLGMSGNDITGGTAQASGSGVIDPSFVWSASRTVTAVPLPPTIWLFVSGLVVFFGVSRRKKKVS